MLSYLDFLSTTIEQARDQYKLLGFTMLSHSWLDGPTIDRMARSVLDSNEFIKRDSMGSRGEPANYYLLDRDASERAIPEIPVIYSMFRPVVSEIVGEQVILSPHHRSSVNIRLYRDGGSEGLHTDTQPVSALLFLSTGAPLQIETFAGWVDIMPVPGYLAVFQGRRCQHRVPVVEHPQNRISVPFNYYFEWDQERPEWIDGMYENKDAVVATS